MAAKPDPSHLFQIGMGFFASKSLLSAVELGVFTKLGKNSLTCKELESLLGVHPRASADFLDTLTALRLLERDGDGASARYRNTVDTGFFLDRASPAYLGGMFEMANARLYPSWGNLTEGLRTGKPQNELKNVANKEGLFEALYSDPARLEGFLAAMSAVQMGNFTALAEKFDFPKHGSVCDLGGAGGAFSIAVARRHPGVRCTSFDLPAVAPIARRNIEAARVADRVTVQSGDFFKEVLPRSPVFTMGNILHDWDLTAKKMLIRKVYDALSPGGCFIAIENIIDDARRENAHGLMMSLNMLIETEGGSNFTGAEFRSWCIEAGFRSTEVMPLEGTSGAAIAYK